MPIIRPDGEQDSLNGVPQSVDRLPTYEPGLTELLQERRARLSQTAEVEENMNALAAANHEIAEDFRQDSVPLPLFDEKTDAHVKGSHRYYAGDLQAAGDGVLGVTDEQRDGMVAFGLTHDLGMGIKQHPEQNEDNDYFWLNFDDPANRDVFVEAFTNHASVVLSPEDGNPSRVAAEFYEWLQTDAVKKNWVVSKILAHGVKGIPTIQRIYERKLAKAGLPLDRARKLALAKALHSTAHHPSSPISFVTNTPYIVGMPIPPLYRKMLGIDFAPTNPQDTENSAHEMAKRLVEAAVRLGFKSQEAIDAHCLQFMQDRLSPGHIREFFMKKGPLVAGNFLAKNKPLEEHTLELYNTELGNQLKGEAQNALNRAKYLGASPQVIAFIESMTTGPQSVAKKRIADQEGALNFIRGDRFRTLAEQAGVTAEFGGTFATVDSDLDSVLRKVQRYLSQQPRKVQEQFRDLETITYMITFLEMVQKQIKRTDAVSKADMEEQFPDSNCAARKVWAAANSCPPGRRRVIYDAMVRAAYAHSDKEIISIETFAPGTKILEFNKQNPHGIVAVIEGTLEAACFDEKAQGQRRLLGSGEKRNTYGEFTSRDPQNRLLCNADVLVVGDQPATVAIMKPQYFQEQLDSSELVRDHVMSLMATRLQEQVR